MKPYNELTNEEKNKRDEERRAKQKYLSSIPGVIETLEKELNDKQEELKNLRALYTKYPDLKRNVNRWKRVRFYSASVNNKVDKYDCSHNCGCCSDSPLEVWPYLETEFGNVYSDPFCFQVGEKHGISGDVAYPGWKKNLREAKIPENIIESVSNSFKKDAEDRRLAVESYDDEDED